ncbi:MAG TPA: hypothetical protein VEJ18_11150 [Planctomycetota bacterium]|nr:hypothetical protein [Planctomycetota bacterium]
MAVYDQSYAPWEGTLAPRWRRVAAIVQMEIARPFRSFWVRLVVGTAFAITTGWLLILFFAASQQTLPVQLAGTRIYRGGFLNFPLFSMILLSLSATVGAPMISRDLRHNALVLYFSRSITRADYLAGKYAALVLFLLAATLGPGLLLFLGQLGMGTERLTTRERLADLGALTLHALVLTAPLSAVVLGFSACARRGYVASILWISVYFAFQIAAGVLENLLKVEWPRLLSWQRITAHLGDLCYREPAADPQLQTGWAAPLAIVLGAAVLGLAVAWRRLRSVEGRE